MGAVRVGGEILVNTATAQDQTNPQIAHHDYGGFVVVWADRSGGVNGAGGDDSGYAVKAQLFTDAGEPVGGEILVNTSVLSNQLNAVATAIDGGFVVAWQDSSQVSGDTTGAAVRAQVFNIDGSKSGGEILVNTTTSGDQALPTLVRLSDGFAAVWTDTGATGGDTSGNALRTRAFDNEGHETQPESLVNTATANSQDDPQIVSLEGGAYVVVWHDTSHDIDIYSGGIKARLYDSEGVPSSPEILVNLSQRYGDQTEPSVTALTGGGFAVAWQDAGQNLLDASGTSVMVKVFGADGVAIGDQIRANTETSGDQGQPVVCAFGGGFVVVWIDNNEVDDSESAIRAQIFDNSGVRFGGEIQINTATVNKQIDPHVAATANGGFVVTWTDYSAGEGGATGDLSSTAVKGQLYDVAGSAVGGEFLVNSATASSQDRAAVVATDHGFVVAWRDVSLGVGGATGDSSGYAVKAQVFSLGQPPEVGGLTGSATWYEGDDAVRVANGATLTDPDSTHLSKVEVSIGTGFEAEQDQLQFEPTGATGDIEGDYNVTTGVMTLTSAGGASLAEFQAALRAVTYRNTSHDPVGETRTIEIVATDDDGYASDVATRTLGVTGQNDAPHGADKTLTINEDAARILTVADFGFSDTDGDALAAVKITTAPTAGSLTYNGAAVASGDSISVADINAGKLIFTTPANANGAGYASFTFQVRDDGGVGNHGLDTDTTPNTLTFNVTAVNDAPVLAGNVVVQIYNEGEPPAVVTSTLTVADVDSTLLTSATVSITNNFQTAQDVLGFTNAAGMSEITGSYNSTTGVLSLSDANGATAAEWQAALRAVTYSNTSDTPNTSARTLHFAVSDGTDTSSGANRTVSVVSVNDAPSGADKTLTVQEDDPQFIIEASWFGFTDVDGHSLKSVTITSLPGAGQLIYDGAEITDVGLVVTYNDLQSGALWFKPAANATGDGYASFGFKVTDTGGTANGGVATDASANTITFNVTAVNDAPVIAHTGTASTFVEGSAPVSVSPTATVTDVDSPSLTSATVSITNNFQAGQDTLGFTNAAGMSEITGSYNAATGVLTLSDTDGATAAEWQAALRAVTFSNSSEALGSTTRQVSFTVSDGTTTSAVATRGLSTAGVNDAPSGADKTLHMEEESEYRITAADLGFTDIDGHTLSGVKITTLPTGGALSYDGSPVTAGQIVVIGPGHDLIYRPAHDGWGEGYASFTFQVQDTGGTSQNGVNLDPTPNTITVDVEPLNDAPVGVDSTLTADQDAPRVLGVADFTFTDVEGDALASVKITTLPTHGTLTFDGAPAVAGVTVTAAELAAGKLVFTPAAGQSGAAYATLTFQVQDDGGTDYDQIDTDGSPNTLTVDVTATPPAPPPSTPSQPTVDGVPVTTTTGTGSDGEPSQTVVIPVVQPGRTDSVGGNNVADIPIVTGGGTTLLSVQAPAGYGLTASGPSTAQTAGTSLTDLIREIQAHTAAGSADQTSLTGGGSGFLGSLTASTPLLVQTIVPTGGGAGAAPLVINGTAAAVGDPMTALVIDTRGLPSGSAIQLNNVEFAAVIGNVTVTGGAGSQTVFGDGASQNLFLGADDDELHGGGGVDTVSSAGGADRLFGDDGADSVSGGIGDDYVHGNAGSDTVSGGEGNDLAYGGKDNDRVNGDGGSDLIFGDLGDDFLQGNAGTDTLDGGAGNDTVHGGQDADQVNGGDGNDAVLGDAGDDALQGGLGNDTATGGSGSDLIHGGQGDDIVYGEAGNDWLSGDKGSDTISGGAGADTFHANAQTGLDWVTDFNFAEGDRVLLDLGTTYSVSQGASGVVIDITGGAQMVLAGVQLSTLGEGWIGLG